MTRDELITALEKATGPDRELDADIQELLHPHFTKKPWRRDKWHDRHWDDSDPLSLHYEVAPRYTASIDAALTLVPEGCGFVLMGCAAKVGSEIAKSTTPALALCIAALRARA